MKKSQGRGCYTFYCRYAGHVNASGHEISAPNARSTLPASPAAIPFFSFSPSNSPLNPAFAISFPDQRTTNWFMMSSPFPTLFICLSYVYAVKVLGPKVMENRKPFQLKNALIAYNLFQMMFSAWLFYEVTSMLPRFLCFSSSTSPGVYASRSLNDSFFFFPRQLENFSPLHATV